LRDAAVRAVVRRALYGRRVDTNPTSNLAGRTVVITGAAGGFGQLIAARAGAVGARVVGTDITPDPLRALVDELTTDGVEALGIEADVTNLDDMHDVIAQTVDRFGRVDAIVNNAGIMPLAFFRDHQEAAEAWHRCIDVNIKGVLNGMIAVHDPMIAQGFGHVVNISSIYGNYPVAGAAVYGATKAAVTAMSESFRVETQGKIKVTIVRPTGVPGTGLGAGIVNPEAIVGILGQNAAEYLATIQAQRDGTADPATLDEDDPHYAKLGPEHVADAVIYALDQPRGVSIGDLTIRATGDRYIL